MSTLRGTQNGEPSARRQDKRVSIRRSTDDETRISTKKPTKRRTRPKRARKSRSSKHPAVENVQIEESSKEQENGGISECQSKNGQHEPRNAVKSKK